MAIIKCPQCGIEISSRSEKCPHCGRVLIEAKQHESVSVEAITQTAKENVIRIVFSFAFVALLFIIVQAIAKQITSAFLGEFGAEIVYYTSRIGFSNIILFLIIGMVFYCVLPLLFKQKPDIGFAAGIIMTLLIAIVCFCIQGTTIEKGLGELGRADLVMSSAGYAKFNGLFSFLLQGALALLSYGNKTKKFMVTALLSLVVFLVIYTIIGLAFVVLLKFGIMGMTFAQLIGSIVIFAFAIIKSNEMKKLWNK